VLFLHVTSQVEGDEHQELFKQRGGTGFPYLAILDADGELLFGRASRNVAGFELAMERARKTQAQLADLARRSEQGDASARYALFLKRVELLRYSAAEARAAFAGLKLSEEDRKVAEARLVELDIREVMSTLTKDPQSRIAAGRTFAKMWAAGTTPADPRTTEWRYFYHFVMVHAEAEKDADLFERALEVYKGQFGSNPRSRRTIESFESKLARLRADGEPKDTAIRKLRIELNLISIKNGEKIRSGI